MIIHPHLHQIGKSRVIVIFMAGIEWVDKLY
jgi:hypothetical protein